MLTDTTSHYLNQRWIPICECLWHSPKSNHRKCPSYYSASCHIPRVQWINIWLWRFIITLMYNSRNWFQSVFICIRIADTSVAFGHVKLPLKAPPLCVSCVGRILGNLLTNWDLVGYICVNEMGCHCSDSGLSPTLRHAVTWSTHSQLDPAEKKLSWNWNQNTTNRF